MNAPKKKEGGSEAPFDLEQAFIMRLPPGPAIALRRDVQSGAMNLRDKLSIEIQHDMRHARVRWGGEVLNAKLVDLPCVVECLKTVDKKTFYKTADISQMLVCSADDDFGPDENDSPKKKEKDKKFSWNHGVTPPLKNVKKRRFRKTLKKKYMDQPDIEKEVKRLFRYDAEAIDVKWEVIMEEDKTTSQNNQSSSVVEASGSIHKREGHMSRNDSSLMDVASYFGEVSSSEDEDDKDINIMDSGDEDASRDPSTPRMVYPNSIERAASESQDMMADTDTAELQSRLVELSNQLVEIRAKRDEHEQQIATLDDNSLLEGLQMELDHLVQAENEKAKEFEILSSMLNQG
ncbi:transcription initiation factor TFIID subunit 7-like [Gigantopelta aegis]|uniref:transcription initiation factor TFIID subunit 7-like n=1 Tax=Gigantopelta aegis TaxID=1735272 RepID=UPI001B88DC9E|nr:transcription initiation factor TFIID subunit 7-like [Gigantopelta aegis]